MESNFTETTTIKLMLVRLVRMFKTSNTMKRLFTTKFMALLVRRTVIEMTEHNTELKFNTRESKIIDKVGLRQFQWLLASTTHLISH